MTTRQKLRRRRRTKIVATVGPASSSRRGARPPVPGRRRRVPAQFQPRHARGPRRPHRHDPRARGTFRPPDRHPRRRAGPETAGRPVRRRARAVADRPGLHASTSTPRPATSRRVNLPHPEIIAAAAIGTMLLLDDGKLRLRVERVRDDRLETEVVVGGPLSDHKGVNVPDMVLPIPALTDKDRVDMAFALDQGVGLYRPVVRAAAGGRGRGASRSRPAAPGCMTKLEKPQALDNLDAILAAVRRGDGGARRSRRRAAARGSAAGAEAHRARRRASWASRWSWRRRCWRA